MPRKRKDILALPAQASKDVKTLTGVMDRWAIHAEDVIKDVVSWAKKHKLLVIVVIGLIAIKRYWLDEQPEVGEDGEEI